MTRRAAITGASGFVGSNLCRHLVREGWQVLVPLRESSSTDNLSDIQDQVTIVRFGDRCDALFDCMNAFKPEVVFHLGALFIAEHRSCDIDALIDSNLKFGVRVLEAMKSSGVRYIVNTGTSWQNYDPESADYDPVDLYAATKEAFEKILLFYDRVEGIHSISLHLFDTYGETDRRPKLINSLVKLAQEHRELNMSPGMQKLDLVHISDVCRAFVHACDLLISGKLPSGGVYSVCGAGQPVSLRELVARFESLSGLKLNVNWGGRPYRKREVMIPFAAGNRLPGWQAQVSLEEGLKKILSHCGVL